MEVLREKVDDIDDKITMHKDLSIVFTRDKGKFHSKYTANQENGECVGYVVAEGAQAQPAKDDQPSTEASNG